MNYLAGTRPLVQLIARRDRLRLAVWVYVIAGLIASTAYSFRSLYHSVGEREAFGRSVVANPSLLALDGPLFDPTSTGGLTAWRFGGIAAVAAAMVSIFTVIRHTRAEEESGRVELVGAGVIGRFAPLTAAFTVVVSVDIAAGALVAILMLVFGASAAGSLALGAGIAAAGIAFAGIAAIAAQLTEGARAATGGALGVLGLAFAARAAGDSTNGGRLSWLSWLSPIGWTQQVRPYANERWWVLALGPGLAVVASAVAYALVGRRDLGAGLLAPRLGPPVAARSLRTPLALAWRQHRPSLVGWSIGLALLGVVFGSSAKGVDTLVDTSAQLEDIIQRMGGTHDLTNAYFTATFGLCGLIAAAYAIQATLRARGEETALRAEVLLSTPVRRLGFAFSHLLLAAIGAAVLLAATGLGAGLAYGTAVHDMGGKLPTLLGAALAQWPAAMVAGAVAALLFGIAPRWSSAAWGVLVVFVLLGQIGPLLKLKQAVLDVSPFTHTPKIPGSALAATPLIALTLVAVVLTTGGILAFRRRDIG